MIERKERYDGVIEEYMCVPLFVRPEREAVLYHHIEKPFRIQSNQFTLTVPKGGCTCAFYWTDRPYNVYVFRDTRNRLIGTYINIVGQTEITESYVLYEDRIIDVAVCPAGRLAVLDEEELPVAMNVFEGGRVEHALNRVLTELPTLVPAVIRTSEQMLKNMVKGEDNRQGK
ncbi:DUF402 domain-containing protein [Geomicrobium sp. JSM 1781026]|uniref:DUF402 domain-containing protein n=1 Tax=Geomicrobium sp. JSM 1781026 TaxID=3344580 RepID=UPI0035BF6D78